MDSTERTARSVWQPAGDNRPAPATRAAPETPMVSDNVLLNNEKPLGEMARNSGLQLSHVIKSEITWLQRAHAPDLFKRYKSCP